MSCTQPRFAVVSATQIGDLTCPLLVQARALTALNIKRVYVWFARLCVPLCVCICKVPLAAQAIKCEIIVWWCNLCTSFYCSVAYTFREHFTQKLKKKPVSSAKSLRGICNIYVCTYICVPRVYIYIYMRHSQSCVQFQGLVRNSVLQCHAHKMWRIWLVRTRAIQIFTLHAFIESTPVFWGMCVSGETPFSRPMSCVSFWLRKQNTPSWNNVLAGYSPKTHMVWVFGENSFQDQLVLFLFG